MRTSLARLAIQRPVATAMGCVAVVLLGGLYAIAGDHNVLDVLLDGKVAFETDYH